MGKTTRKKSDGRKRAVQDEINEQDSEQNTLSNQAVENGDSVVMENVNRNKRKKTKKDETKQVAQVQLITNQEEIINAEQNVQDSVLSGTVTTAVEIHAENVRMETISNEMQVETEEGELLDADDDEISFRRDYLVPATNLSANNAVDLARMQQKFDMPTAPPDPKFLEVGMLNEAMFKFEEMIKRSQLETASMVQKQMNDMKASMDAITSPNGAQPKRLEGGQNTSKSPQESETAASEVTIYTNAVKGPVLNQSTNLIANNVNMLSSSDEEAVNTSDENMDFQNMRDIEQNEHLSQGHNEIEIMKFIAENRPDDNEQQRQQGKDRRTIVIQKRRGADEVPQPKPGTSTQITPDQRADQMIKEAEAVKARILDAPGRGYQFNDQMYGNETEQIDFRNNFVHSVMVDESFLLVASHLDQNTYDKIVKGEYVDFARLIPKDKVLMEEENKMQMVNRDGQMYFVPANGDKLAISSFSKWEQAFRVFSDVFTRAHPERSSELVQYNHIIHTASLTYAWDNVYMYDKDFRLHMLRHPMRSWGLLLQQAWALRLKDRVRYDHGPTTPVRAGGSGNGGGCRRFNRGRCSYGFNCKFDHRCFYCNKTGHGVINCRQLRFEKNDKNDRYHKDNRYERNWEKGGSSGQYHNNSTKNTNHHSNNSSTTGNASNAKQADKK